MILASIIDIHFYETFSNPSLNLSACTSLLIKALCLPSSTSLDQSTCTSLLIRHSVYPDPSHFAWSLNYFCK